LLIVLKKTPGHLRVSSFLNPCNSKEQNGSRSDMHGSRITPSSPLIPLRGIEVRCAFASALSGTHRFPVSRLFFGAKSNRANPGTPTHMAASSDDSRGSSPVGTSPQSAPPQHDPLDSGGMGAEGVADLCKAALDHDTVVDQQLAWWDSWATRWKDEFMPGFRIRDDDAKTEEARRVRRKCKDAKTPKDETAQQVEEALAQLRFVVPPCPAPHCPTIEDDFPRAQLVLHEQRAEEAGKRIDAIKHQMERDEKAEDEVAISKAMLGQSPDHDAFSCVRCSGLANVAWRRFCCVLLL